MKEFLKQWDQVSRKVQFSPTIELNVYHYYTSPTSPSNLSFKINFCIGETR